jgi:hypothetical protein
LLEQSTERRRAGKREKERYECLFLCMLHKGVIDMPKNLIAALFFLGFAALTMPTAYAQGSPEVIVRQGDTIEWVAVGPPPHRVRFGSPGTTPFAEVSALLEFTPTLTAGPGGEADSPQAPTGTLLTAKVKDDAVPGKTFIFNCGVHPGGQMLSLPFTIAAKVAGEQPRRHRIMGVTGLHWHLHIDTTP